MELTINESKKPVWEGVNLSDIFSSDLFHDVDMSHPWLDEVGKEPDHQRAFHSNLGSITVLDRMTGFSFGRDVETGYRDCDGKFWLASGGVDVTISGCKTVGEAIQWIKDRSNNCKGE